jgi:hypothetical protein
MNWFLLAECCSPHPQGSKESCVAYPKKAESRMICFPLFVVKFAGLREIEAI